MPKLPSHAEIETAVLASVNELMGKFCNEPYSFLYESDLQATLFAELRSRLTGRVEIPRSNSAQPPYGLGLVYSEYLSRIDIACLDPDLVRSAESKRHKGHDTYIYNLPVYAGIELKYLKMGDRFDFSACLGDFGKLKALGIVRPLALGFIQDAGDEDVFLSAVPAEWKRESEVAKVSALDCICVVSPNDTFIFTKTTPG